MADADPPSYEQAIGSASFSRQPRNGITPEARRSIEDESRPLPAGWVRSFDPDSQHQFFVNTKVDPPRAVWHHPYDDDDYMNSLSSEERERIRGLSRHPSHHDVTAETTDEEGDGHSHSHGKSHASASASNASGPKRSLGRKMKDKFTGTTHEKRAKDRQQREQNERDMYKQHQLFRRGLAAAIETNQPQLLGQDDDGIEVYLEPPGSRYSGVQRVERLSPYLSEIIYRPPGPLNKRARHIRPDPIYPGGYGGPYQRPYGTYNRPYGYGYGGGMGMMPMAGPLFGGLMLGGLAGGLMF
ncbi:hypothetical protein BKA67DRAFT_558996 [Truncatella angustata]|uniref:WW domain-containing protein n=1 Tax=Truncatella angustata TaxID=152316 RepID=A0A9P8ZXJ2_9PEZI|nr:uncharacterized protein BKA67DRAFT_558996 [Truncatella angustata]KAH6654936.1 hypothetical protein BKA67DRAFT_558996 [Truncatella angustata]KAH8196889.1 hypothetical protein TruAng_008944 [Truncatella angustata]